MGALQSPRRQSWALGVLGWSRKVSFLLFHLRKSLGASTGCVNCLGKPLLETIPHKLGICIATSSFDRTALQSARNSCKTWYPLERGRDGCFDTFKIIIRPP
jgi:hypothetical protein